MHAHTGVKTHRIGPVRGRMVARVDRRRPSQSGTACERRRGLATGASVEREGREGKCPVPRVRRIPRNVRTKEVACTVPIPHWVRQVL